LTEPGCLVLLRHGESVLNAEDRFTGLLDVGLTERGEAEAVSAAALLVSAEFRPDIVYVSVLRRAIRTCEIVLDRLGCTEIPRVTAWQLMERNYGALTGMRRSEVYAEYGRNRFLAWRRGPSQQPPPLNADGLRRLHMQPALATIPARAVTPTEALADVIQRVAALWRAHIAKDLRAGRNVLVIAHGNSLRALCSILDALEESELADLNIPTGQPLLYVFDARFEPQPRCGRYLDPGTAEAAASAIARAGGT
jgi:2,3-bisphosphoglycerate-dependent phosphoglycerate mutase